MKGDRGPLDPGPPLSCRPAHPRTSDLRILPLSPPTGEAPEVRILDVRIVLVSTLTRDKLAAFG